MTWPEGVWVLSGFIVMFALFILFLIDTLLRGFSDHHFFLIPYNKWEVQSLIARWRHGKEETAPSRNDIYS